MSQPSLCYSITDWHDRYENNRTRGMKVMQWVPVPNKHDGDGYTELIDHPAGPAHFACWIAALQVASRCQPRGTLLRDNGAPHDERTLARITRIPAEVWREAIPRLVSIGWVSSQVVAGSDVAPSCGQTAGNPHPSGTLLTMEGNGMEGTEGREDDAPPSAPLPPDDEPKPEKKTSPQEQTALDLAVVLGCSTNVARQQVRSLRKAGWTLEEIRARFPLGEPGDNPWQWTKAVHRAGRLTVPWDRVVQAWNENTKGCPALPFTDKPGAERIAAAGKVWALIVQRIETDDPDLCVAYFAGAARRFGADSWNVANNQGFDRFAKDAERWLDEWTAPEHFDPATYDPKKLPPDHPHHALWASS